MGVLLRFMTDKGTPPQLIDFVLLLLLLLMGVGEGNSTESGVHGESSGAKGSSVVGENSRLQIRKIIHSA